MENVSLTQVAVGTISAIVLAGGIYYLSRDDSPAFNAKVNTKEELIEILREMNLEFTCLYARSYNILLKLRENGQLDNKKNELRAQIQQSIGAKTRQVLDSYTDKGYTEQLLNDWIQYFKDDPQVKDIAQRNIKLEKDVFENVKVEEITFTEDIPEKLTKEMYVRIYRKIHAALRHDLYIRILDERKESKVINIPEDVFNKLYKEVHNKFNDVRLDIIELMLEDTFQKKDAKRFMQMAYVKFATVSNYKDEQGNVIRSRWADQITEVGNKHDQYIDEMVKGKFYEGIEKDPRDSQQPDEKVDLSGLPTYTSQKTTLDNQRNVTQMAPGTEKTVNKFIEKFRKNREAKQAEKEANQAEESKDDKKVEEVAASEDKPVVVEEVKPTEVKQEESNKQEETKPVEAKQEEVTPTEVQQEESQKQEETKPVEVEQEEVKPAEVKQEETKPTEVKQEDNKKNELEATLETVEVNDEPAPQKDQKTDKVEEKKEPETKKEETVVAAEEQNNKEEQKPKEVSEPVKAVEEVKEVAKEVTQDQSAKKEQSATENEHVSKDNDANKTEQTN